GDEVELARHAAGRHARHRPDRAVARVDRDERGSRVVRPVERLRDRATSSALERRVDRRVDAEPARADGVRAVLVDQLVPDEAEEVRLADRRVEAARPEAEPSLGEARAVFEPGEVAVLVHRTEHLAPPCERVGRTVEGVVQRRRLRQPGEEGRLEQRELARMLGEVRLRGGLDAVRVVAEVDLVHPLAEDLRLRPVLVELDREAGLLDLALERPLLRDVEVANELLRQRRAALDDLARGEVLPERPQDRAVVDTAVLVEAAVLDVDGSLPQPRTDPPERDRLAVPFGRDRAEERAVGRVDERVLADPDRPERRERAAAGERRGGRQTRGHERHRNREQHQDREDDRGCAATRLRTPARPAATEVAGRVLERAAPRRAHAAAPQMPRARSVSCTRSRRSASASSAAASVGAHTRTVTVAFASRALTKTSGAWSPARSRRSRSTSSCRSVPSGTCSVTEATFSRLTIVELRMVSAARRSFGITTLVLSAARSTV